MKRFVVVWIAMWMVMVCAMACAATIALAGHDAPEKAYQDQWCSECGGVMEFVLPDKARVDCLTQEYAIEFDFASKWAESVGQSLYYAAMTGRLPGVVLILERPEDARYLNRLNVLANRYGIRVWTMRGADLRTGADHP